MKKVSSSSRKSRKAHFSAPSHIRRKLMSSHLSKDLRSKHKVRSLPIHKDDEIRIKRGGGAFKDKTGKVIAVYRKKWCIHVDKFTKEKANGQSVQIPIHPSNCQIVNLKLNEARKKIINRKVESGKGKIGRADID